jgi:hypothetical protein
MPDGPGERTPPAVSTIAYLPPAVAWSVRIAFTLDSIDVSDLGIDESLSNVAAR